MVEKLGGQMSGLVAGYNTAPHHQVFDRNVHNPRRWRTRSAYLFELLDSSLVNTSALVDQVS